MTAKITAQIGDVSTLHTRSQSADSSPRAPLPRSARALASVIALGHVGRDDVSGLSRRGSGLLLVSSPRRGVVEFWKLQFPVEHDSRELNENARFLEFSCEKSIKT
jgi:hypothetical protein